MRNVKNIIGWMVCFKYESPRMSTTIDYHTCKDANSAAAITKNLLGESGDDNKNWVEVKQFCFWIATELAWKCESMWSSYVVGKVSDRSY